MKDNIKKFIKYFIIIAVVLGWGYLIFAYITSNAAEKTAVQNYCNQKCSYNKNSFLWEFSNQDGISKGFTTSEECFSYCSKVKEGFAYKIKDYATASLNSILKLFQK
jgi:hypothetical protein